VRGSRVVCLPRCALFARCSPALDAPPRRHQAYLPSILTHYSALDAPPRRQPARISARRCQASILSMLARISGRRCQASILSMLARISACRCQASCVCAKYARTRACRHAAAGGRAFTRDPLTLRGGDHLKGPRLQPSRATLSPGTSRVLERGTKGSRIW
jgi:hypothetical protein